MATYSTEEIMNESAKMMVAGVGKSHSASDVSTEASISEWERVGLGEMMCTVYVLT